LFRVFKEFSAPATVRASFDFTFKVHVMVTAGSIPVEYTFTAAINSNLSIIIHKKLSGSELRFVFDKRMGARSFVLFLWLA
jgi:hypothetical protein